MSHGSKRHGQLRTAWIAPTEQKRRPGRPYPPNAHIWFDGVFIKEEDLPRSFPAWRMASLGGVCTELHALHTQPRFFATYYAWLEKAAEIAMLPLLANATEKAVYDACVGVLNKNMYFNDTLIRLSIFPTYAAHDPPHAALTSSLLLESRKVENTGFTPRSQGLLIRVLEDGAKALNRRSNVQWISDPINWISQQLLKNSLWSEHLLLNQKGRVAHAVRGMVYCLIGDEIITPPLSEGVRYDPIRTYIDEACLAATGKKPLRRPLTLQELENAKEVFLGSSAFGIESVVGVNNSRYNIRLSNAICESLNRIYFPELHL